MLGAIIYSLWNERKGVIFRGGNTTAMALMNLVLRDVRVKMGAVGIQNEGGRRKKVNAVKIGDRHKMLLTL